MLCLFPSKIFYFSISSLNNCLSVSIILEKVRKSEFFCFSKSILSNFVPIPIQWPCTFYLKYTYSLVSIYFVFYSSMYLCDLLSLLSPSAFSNMHCSICHSCSYAILDHVSFFQSSIISISHLHIIFIYNINSFFFLIQFPSISIHLLFHPSSVSLMAFWHICSKNLFVDTISIKLFPKFPVMYCLVWSLKFLLYQKLVTPNIFSQWNSDFQWKTILFSWLPTEKWCLLFMFPNLPLRPTFCSLYFCGMYLYCYTFMS